MSLSPAQQRGAIIAEERQSRWRLNQSPDFVALSDLQIGVLSTSFGFSRSDLLTLAAGLSGALDPELYPPWSELPKPPAQSLGRKELQAAIREVAKAKWETLDAAMRLDTLSSSVHRSELNRTTKLLNRAHQELREAQGVMERLAPGHEIFRVKELIAGRLSDFRRPLVLHEIFGFWKSAGRNLTFTTDPITSERRGRLVEFVNAVVACITEPPTVLSGETIIAEIKAYRNAKRRR